MNRCKQTKFSQVAENLHKEVQTHTKSNEEKPLPSVRTLAVRLQTSTKTVIQALQLFVENGILHQAPVNGRYYLAHIKPSSYSNQPGISEQNTENGIVDRIKNELLMRPRTKHEAIPSFTQLRKTYRCSHKKVREALKSLEKQGFLKPEGRSFKLNTPAQDSTCQSRIYIAGLPRFLYQFPFRDIFREIEMVLESHGWREPGYLLKDQKTSSPIPPDHHIAGFITLYHALSEKNGLVMHRLKPLIPQVIIDPGETLADEGVGCKFFRKIWPDNAYAGRALGMHLRATGHQRIAFITHYPQNRMRSGCLITEEIISALPNWNRYSAIREEQSMLRGMGGAMKYASETPPTTLMLSMRPNNSSLVLPSGIPLESKTGMIKV